MNATCRPENDALPLDLETMRSTALRFLAEAEQPFAPGELEIRTLLLRGHAMLLISEVTSAAENLPRDDVPRACALACIGEANMRLKLQAHPGLDTRMAHAQRLARSVRALCDHYESLTEVLMCVVCDRPLGTGEPTRPYVCSSTSSERRARSVHAACAPDQAAT